MRQLVAMACTQTHDQASMQANSPPETSREWASAAEAQEATDGCSAPQQPPARHGPPGASIHRCFARPLHCHGAPQMPLVQLGARDLIRLRAACRRSSGSGLIALPAHGNSWRLGCEDLSLR